jgi:hypothetical protein
MCPGGPANQKQTVMTSTITVHAVKVHLTDKEHA